MTIRKVPAVVLLIFITIHVIILTGTIVSKSMQLQNILLSGSRALPADVTY